MNRLVKGRNIVTHWVVFSCNSVHTKDVYMSTGRQVDKTEKDKQFKSYWKCMSCLLNSGWRIIFDRILIDRPTGRQVDKSTGRQGEIILLYNTTCINYKKMPLLENKMIDGPTGRQVDRSTSRQIEKEEFTSTQRALLIDFRIEK